MSSSFMLGLLKALRVLVFILGVMVGAVRRPITRPCLGLRRLLWWFSAHSLGDFIGSGAYKIMILHLPRGWLLHRRDRTPDCVDGSRQAASSGSYPRLRRWFMTAPDRICDLLQFRVDPQFLLVFGGPFAQFWWIFVHFWWILDRLDPSSDPILRVSSLFQFESALYHAFPSADGLNTSRTFQTHQDA